MNERQVNVLKNAISERGCIPLHAVDEPLVNNLCAIISDLYRLVERAADMNLPSQRLEQCWREADNMRSAAQEIISLCDDK